MVFKGRPFVLNLAVLLAPVGMAASLTEKALANRINVLKNLSLSFFRSFSVASPSENPTTSSTSNKSKRRKKKKNLFEVAQFLPNWGLGFHMAKAHWSGVSYQITKINLYKDGRHGKAWGIAHKQGLPAADAPKKISGVHKRCWKYIPSLSKPIAEKPNLTVTPESCQSLEVEAT